MGVARKQSTPNFLKNEHFSLSDTHTYVCVSGGKKCLFFGKFDMLCFLLTPVLRFAFFALLPTIFLKKESVTRTLVKELGNSWIET